MVSREELNKLPDKPGVYMMKNVRGEIIYVGKAISLKKRVRQYFQKSSNQGLKVASMVKNIYDFEYIIVDNEVESLILESNLIKKHKPRYNILLRDDKQYPYIKVTLNERFPRVVKTREVKKDGAKYFGPYPSATAVNDAIDIIHEIYPVRTCKLNLDSDESIGKYRPCLNYYIERCKAPCQGFIKEELYNEMIDEVIRFLEGRTEKLMGLIESKMIIAAKSLEYEKAGMYRDQLESLRILKEEQKIVSTSSEDQDVIGLARGIEEVCIQIFFVRVGKIIGREHYILEDTYGTERSEIIASFIKQFYNGAAYIPREILIDSELKDRQVIEDWLSRKKGSRVSLHFPQRGEKVRLVEMVNTNARDMINKHGDRLLKKKRDNLKALDEIKEIIGLDTIPLRIEAYDISNISGTNSVGSMVVFENGEAKKSDYRRFKINSVDGPDDYKSMQEVLARRFKRGIEELELLKEKDLEIEGFSKFPDLIMIDGGKGHVNAILKTMDEMGLNIPVSGLVKDKFHMTRGIIYRGIEYEMPVYSPGFKMITSIQDEAHRFAINYHRNLRSKDLFKSQLDNIDHIGPKRKRELLDYFKSIEKIKKAGIDELLEVESMNKRAAESLYGHFRGEVEDE